MNTVKTLVVADPDSCPFMSPLHGCTLKDYSRYDDYVTELHYDCPLQEYSLLVVRS